MLNSNISQRGNLIEVETKFWNRCFLLSDEARACLFVCGKHTDKHGKTRRYPYSPSFSRQQLHICACLHGEDFSVQLWQDLSQLWHDMSQLWHDLSQHTVTLLSHQHITWRQMKQKWRLTFVMGGKKAILVVHVGGGPVLGGRGRWLCAASKVASPEAPPLQCNWAGRF